MCVIIFNIKYNVAKLIEVNAPISGQKRLFILKKENFMEQRIKKAKLFRTLKVIYYCLGMPLLLLAVMALSSQIYGRFPFAGNGNDASLSAMVRVFFNSPAMYSVWIALAIWVVIGLVQIICNIAIKNRHSKAMVVIAVMLVVLLVPVFVIDAVYSAKVDEIAIQAGELNSAIEVKDYKTQLSYYRYNSSGKEGAGTKTSYTDELIDDVEGFLRVYNIPFYGDEKLSKATNFANQALYYDDPIFVVAGFDYNGDGVINADDHVRVDATFDHKSMKEVDGRFWFDEFTFTDLNGKKTTIKHNLYAAVYEQIIPVSYGNIKNTVTYANYVWYNADKFVAVDEDYMPKKVDGVYGPAFYNQNGLLADGYIFDINVALNILEAYYQSQADMATAYAAYLAAGGTLEEDDLKSEILASANERLEKHYLDSGDDYLVALYESENAAAAGYSLDAGRLNMILSSLGKNVGSAGLIDSAMDLVGLIGLSFTLPEIIGLISEDLVPVVNALLSDDIKSLTLSIGKNSAGAVAITATITNTGASAELTLDENLSLEQVKGLLDLLGINNDVLAAVLGMRGLAVTADDAVSQEAFNNMIVGVLESLYSFASPVILPVYDFYAVELDESASAEDKAYNDYAAAYAQYMRASYEGGTHGYMAHCRLIGSDLGDGSYDASLGLSSLTEVQQLKTDLSYKPEMYSILIVRNMLMTFSVFALFFTAMYYIAADREILWATGKIEGKAKKTKKSKKGEVAPEENSALLDVENTEEV